MTTNKAGMVFLLFLAGAISVALSGCKPTEFTNAQSWSDGGGSGAVNIHKMGGDIDVDDAPHGATLTTMGGNIRLGSVASFAKLKTMGGAITIDRAGAPVDATTMGGNITVSRADASLLATTMGGDITAHLADSSGGSSPAARDVHLTTMGGTITLTVPKDFPMEIHITLAYTKNAERAFRIIDDFGLAQSTSADWDSSNGSPRKYIRAEGRVGSGQNHVEIKVVNGDVILKRETSS